MKSPLVLSPFSAQDVCTLRPAAPHSAPSGIGPAFWGLRNPSNDGGVSGSLYSSTPENSVPENATPLQVEQPELFRFERPVQSHTAIRLSPVVGAPANELKSSEPTMNPVPPWVLSH